MICRTSILLSILVGLATCNYFESNFEASVISAIRSGGKPNASLGKGHVENCNETAASINIYWDPEPVKEGKPDTISGDITFLTEDFEEGTVEVDAAFVRRSYPVKCSDLTNPPACKKGQKIMVNRTFPVPAAIPVTKLSLTASLRSKKTGNVVMCAKATVHFERAESN